MVHVPSPPALVVRPQQNHFRWREWTALALFWLASLIVIAALVWVLRERTPGEGIESLKQLLDRNAELEQRVAVLERADQVSRAANAELQRQIGQRQEDIAGLRADLGFYSRLTSADAKRDGLAVQALRIEAAAGMPRLYNFDLTLTQNLKPGQVASGRAKLSISGMRANQLVTLDWNALAQNQDENGLAFSFKYFEQIKGTLLLPEGFTPTGIHVNVDGGAEMGKATRDFGWTEASSAQGVRNAG